VDADTVVGATPTWDIEIHAKSPHDAAFRLLDNAVDLTGTGDRVFAIGTNANYDPLDATELLAVPLPRQWYLRLNLVLATSITADISLTPF